MGVSEKVEIYVLAHPDRTEAHERMLASLSESDARSIVWCVQARGIDPRLHWRATHELAAESTAEWVILLEDDVLVSRHLIHNVLRWPAANDVRFGAGWLFDCGGKGERWVDEPMTMAQGILYRPGLLSRFVDRAWDRLSRDPSVVWDYAISRGVLDCGLRIRVHGPSQVEHLWELPSVLSHLHGYRRSSSAGTFDPDWKR
jgi:hypothetical protein